MAGHRERLAQGFGAVVNAWQHMAVQIDHWGNLEKSAGKTPRPAGIAPRQTRGGPWLGRRAAQAAVQGEGGLLDFMRTEAITP